MACARYTYRPLSSGGSTMRRPYFNLSDTEADRPVTGNQAGDFSYTLDSKKLWHWNGTAWAEVAPVAGTTEWGDIGGTLAEQVDLQAELDAKADEDHDHSIAEVVGLTTALDGKAATDHNHSGVYDPSGTASAAVAAHEGAADPHPSYQRESEKGQVNGYAGLGAGSTVPTAQLPAASTTSAGIVELATSGESASGVAVQGNDARLSDSRPPNGSASGDLAGSYPAPTVSQARGLLETAGPTMLTLGAVADGEYLRRVGSTVVGATPAGGGGGGNSVEVSIILSGAGLYSTTITGQSWVTASTKLVAAPFATTLDGQTLEEYALAGLSVVCANRVAGVGFDIFVRNPSGVVGTFRIHVIGA